MSFSSDKKNRYPKGKSSKKRESFMEVLDLIIEKCENAPDPLPVAKVELHTTLIKLLARKVDAGHAGQRREKRRYKRVV